MKIKVLATAQSANYYEFSGDTVTAYLDGGSKSYDFSALQEGDQVTMEDLGGVRVIRAAQRNSEGELEVTLTQAVGAGHWSESGWMDPEEYDPDGANVEFDATKPFAGVPRIKTRNGWQAVVMG